MERTIQGPDWERGDKDAVCAWLGIRESALDALIKAGVFPPGDEINKANVTWHWQTVVACSWIMPHLLRLRDGIAEKS
jgi:hypothetical protein